MNLGFASKNGLPRQFYAHTHAAGREHWEPLTDHLRKVADRAAAFATPFGAAELARLAGWWHDLGKASEAFQNDVLGAGLDESEGEAGDADDRPRRRVDHSTAGARHAVQALGPHLGHLLAYGIAGHHGRLPNASEVDAESSLKTRLDPRARTIANVTPPDGVPMQADPDSVAPMTLHLASDASTQAFQCATLTRMLYSALVDADRLETERFCDPARSRKRPDGGPAMSELLSTLNAHLVELTAARATNFSPVDRQRAGVLAACREAAGDKPGIFSLTVPTGGGKTLASMAFALEHADENGHHRVVFALPYTSIIEQTAATYTDIFGCDAVLEHHSNLSAETRSKRSIRGEMAAENFDAPVIVTTNVQLFESLFSAHGGTCRKLHRLARSVIVLDEAQSIPPQLLKPTLAMLQELVTNYGCTIVLCTATQPAVVRREGFPIGLDQVREIIPDPPCLYETMRRVRVQGLGKLSDDALVERIASHEQVLCIVNTRKHAAEITHRLADRGEVIHLSAAMCPEHRSDLVRQIKKSLDEVRPLRVVSTQVIEAGVDVDFPAVYRALAGFDSIAQAAGRCNREGRLEQGDVFLFETDHRPAPSLQPHVHAAAELLDRHPDPLALDAMTAYFELVYWKRQHEGEKPWDHRDVMGCFQSPTHHQFRDADERFRWIESDTTPVLVPYGPVGKGLVDRLIAGDEPDWLQMRAAQRYSVSVYQPQLQALVNQTTVAPAWEGRVWVMTNPEAYDGVLGLRMDVAGWRGGNLMV